MLLKGGLLRLARPRKQPDDCARVRRAMEEFAKVCDDASSPALHCGIIMAEVGSTGSGHRRGPRFLCRQGTGGREGGRSSHDLALRTRGLHPSRTDTYPPPFHGGLAQAVRTRNADLTIAVLGTYAPLLRMHPAVEEAAEACFQLLDA